MVLEQGIRKTNKFTIRESQNNLLAIELSVLITLEIKKTTQMSGFFYMKYSSDPTGFSPNVF